MNTKIPASALEHFIGKERFYLESCVNFHKCIKETVTCKHVTSSYPPAPCKPKKTTISSTFWID